MFYLYTMNRSRLFILIALVLAGVSCGPSAESMAKKSCELYGKLNQADLSNDTIGADKYSMEIISFEKKLTEEYQHKNPEWLLKYVKLRDQCILETTK